MVATIAHAIMLALTLTAVAAMFASFLALILWLLRSIVLRGLRLLGFNHDPVKSSNPASQPAAIVCARLRAVPSPPASPSNERA
jgi:hypothetical protein